MRLPRSADVYVASVAADRAILTSPSFSEPFTHQGLGKFALQSRVSSKCITSARALRLVMNESVSPPRLVCSYLWANKNLSMRSHSDYRLGFSTAKFCWI